MTLTYQQALEYIYSFDDPYLAALRDRGKPGWGLSTIRAILNRLGDPHLAYPTVHVAGTKGKGSTSAFITQGLIESGLKTGLYISPHLQDWRERIQINRQWIGEEALARLVEDFQPYGDQMPDLSAFEVITALAFWHFAREGCDVAVIEVGLGGRLDATSVVEPEVAVLTSISLDHTQFLGDTVAQIAQDKSAIIKPGVPVVSAPQVPEAQAAIEARAAEMVSPLILIGRDWHVQTLSLTWEGSEALIGEGDDLQRYTVALPGAFQVENAAVALATLRELERAGLPVRREAWHGALAHTRWPGRLETISREPRVLVDGAHNPYSIRQLLASLEILLEGRSLSVVFGCMADKDIDGMLEALLPAARQVVLTQADHPRAASPEALWKRAIQQIRAAQQQGADWAGEITLMQAADVGGAVRLALGRAEPDQVLCITGSLAVAGEARTALLEDDSLITAIPGRFSAGHSPA
ncbi:MAG TPA: bifunctional folylpolyglutamate synthase/dihydrofolate synthase [Chloroflexi bacterium]|nr:bifunctional folylpolyglutamate synthase/dihydrofolate synthase [Chloroflexota bacterium]